MSVDEAILDSSELGVNPSTLRLYAWDPACMSLGYAQPASDVNKAALDANAWDLVRRPTGGRAVLHVDELTYSVAGSIGDPRLSGTILESYNRLAKALTRSLNLLSMNVEINQEKITDNKDKVNPVCFEVPSTYEITVGGKKLVGSAQVRRKNSMLQHGSLPLSGDLSRIVNVLVFPNEEARKIAGRNLLNRATTVESALQRKISWEEASRAFVQAFKEELKMEFQQMELSTEEISRARELERTKYLNWEWTKNRRI